MTAPCILIIDDEGGVRKLLSKVLNDEGYKVLTAANGGEAVGIVKEKRVDLALVDLRMPGIDGIETIRRIKKVNSSIVNIIITAYGQMESVREATSLGVFDYVTKPFDLEYIKALIRHLLVDVRLKPLPFDKDLEEILTGELTQSEALRQKASSLKREVTAKTGSLKETEEDLNRHMAAHYSSFFEFVLYRVRDLFTNTYFIALVLSVMIGATLGYISTTIAKNKSLPGAAYKESVAPKREATLSDFYEKLDKIEYWLKRDMERGAERVELEREE